MHSNVNVTSLPYSFCRLEEPIVNTLRGKNGLHAFGNNSAESEPIWIRSGTFWAKCGGLDLADFGRDPCSSDSLRGVGFCRITQKLLTKFTRLATSGRHNSAMITNAENSRPHGPPTWCLVSTFSVRNFRINSKSFPWAVRCEPERDLPKFSATSVVQYCSIIRYSAVEAQSHRYGSGAA